MQKIEIPHANKMNLNKLELEESYTKIKEQVAIKYDICLINKI